jgi:glutamine phosphoribosylpyrophosphate amidotransferase
MCGLFGVIKSQNSEPLSQAALAFEWLGYYARLRGSSAAGFAAFTGRKQRHPATTPATLALSASKLRIDGWHIHKTATNFGQFWHKNRSVYRELADRASLLIGHTRLATIGNRFSLNNASPLVVGDLIGTHNGGVNKTASDNLSDF